MTDITVLVSTRTDGVFVFGPNEAQEVSGQSVCYLTPNKAGGTLAILDDHTLARRSAHGTWSTLATTESAISCCIPVKDAIYLGTDDAHLLRLNRDGKLEQLSGFDVIAGRDAWYAGSAVVNGQVLGPPLGIRSITATADEAAVLANVHVGGIPRSIDGGVTWKQTIDIDHDVHEVCAHPSRPEVAAAATGIGLAISRDGGARWKIERDGLHAVYCSAVAFMGDDVLVAASTDHFANEGKIYRFPLNTTGQFLPLRSGLPESLDGIVDTGCVSAEASAIAIADKGGNVYLSTELGTSWKLLASSLPSPSRILIVK